MTTLSAGRLLRNPQGSRLVHSLESATGIVLLLIMWEVAPNVGWVSPTSVPPLTDVVAEIGMVFRDAEFWPQVATSARRWMLGLLAATVVGVTLGLFMARSRAFRLTVDPLLALFYTVPKVALSVMLIVWFGSGESTMVMIISLGCIIPLVISTFHGASGVPAKLLWSASSLGTGRVRSVVRVVTPAALPEILSGFRIGIALSLFTMLGSELLIRGGGLGSYLFTNFDNGQYTRVWAISVLVAVAGFALDFGYSKLVTRTFAWLEGDV